MRRPLVWITVALISGAAFSSTVKPPFPYFLAAFLAAWFLTVLLILLKRRTLAALLVLATSFLLGNCIYQLKAYVSEIPGQLAQHHASEGPRHVTLTGAVTECRPPLEGERLTFTAHVESVEIGGIQVQAEGRTLVNWYQPSCSVRVGDIVRVTGKLQPLKGFKNPGTFDYERYVHRRGIYTRLYARGPDSVIVTGRKNLGRPLRWVEFFRRKGLEIISHSTRTDETRAFISAILLGERGLLTGEMKDWFKQTGTFHLLAISGLHVGLVYLIASLALNPLSLGIKTRAALAILVVWTYALITGGNTPVIRASIMLTLVLAEYYLGREGDFLTAVALAALIIVALDPVVIDEVSFQLSFTAVVLLCTFEPLFSETIYPALQQRLQKIPSAILHKLALTLFASLVVGIGMFPLIAYYFNLVSFVFPIANLIVVPVLSLVLVSGFACLLAGFVWMKAAMVFGLVTEVIAWTIFGVVKFCSLIPGSSMYVASPPIWVLVLEALAIVLVWWRTRLSHKVMVLAAAAALTVTVVFVGTRVSGTTLRATFLDVGDADSCFIEFPGGETMLVDTGFATPYLDCGESLIAPFLWKKRKRIDTLVLTHPDADHTGGALFLLKNSRIGRLVLADLSETPREFSEILHVAKEKGLTIEKVSAGDSIFTETDMVRVKVLNPPEKTSRGAFTDNETSIVLRITYGETSLLLTGDAERKALRLISDSNEQIESRLLKAPHHGLKSSFNKRFVELARPELVVISGRTHRINERMVDRISSYASLCETVLSTKDSGAIEIESDGRRIRTKVTREVPKNLF